MKESRAFRVKLKSAKTTTYPGKAHERNCSTFTNNCTSRFVNDFEADEPGDLGCVDQQWTDHDVGTLALDGGRRQLPDDPTRVSQQDPMAASDVDFLHEPVVASRS